MIAIENIAQTVHSQKESDVITVKAETDEYISIPEMRRRLHEMVKQVYSDDTYGHSLKG